MGKEKEKRKKNKRPRPKGKGRSKQRQPDMGGMGNCTECDRMLYKAGGYQKTGMCGPCATGDASTETENGETW